MINKPTLNSFTFHEYSGQNPEENMFMAQLFIEQCHAYLHELAIFFETDCHQDWHEVAHAFKGMAACAGTDALYDLCTNAQTHYQSDKYTKKVILRALENEVSNIIQSFQCYLKGDNYGILSQ